MSGIIKSKADEAKHQEHTTASRRYKVQKYIETTSKIGHEINTLQDDENNGNDQQFEKKDYNFDRTDYNRIKFKEKYV